MTQSGSGWQTTLADLALILFVTLAAGGLSGTERTGKAPAPRTPPVTLALWEGGDAPLSDWLAAQQADPRATLELTIHYSPAAHDAAWRRASALEAQARPFSRRVRIVLIPATHDRLQATLAYR